MKPDVECRGAWEPSLTPMAVPCCRALAMESPLSELSRIDTAQFRVADRRALALAKSVGTTGAGVGNPPELTQVSSSSTSEDLGSCCTEASLASGGGAGAKPCLEKWRREEVVPCQSV